MTDFLEHKLEKPDFKVSLKEIDEKIKGNEEVRSMFERKKAGLKEVENHFNRLIEIAEENIKMLYEARKERKELDEKEQENEANGR